MALIDDLVVRFSATLADMERAAASLGAFLAAQCIPATPRYHVELAFDEVTANIIRHAGATADVELRVRFESDQIVMRFEDNGAPFDPSKHSDPDLPTTLDEAQVGGLGIMLVRKIAARMAYERDPHGRNVLTLGIAAR